MSTNGRMYFRFVACPNVVLLEPNLGACRATGYRGVVRQGTEVLLDNIPRCRVTGYLGVTIRDI